MRERLRYRASLTAALLILLAGCSSMEPRIGQDEPSKWSLIWEDEFEGGTLDERWWQAETGNGFFAGEQWVSGWGNGELQYYTDDEHNVSVADGMLTLRADKELITGPAGGSESNFEYTSGKIITKDAASWLYGRFEIRARFPEGKGLWPAVWMLPEEEHYGSWAASGEIDIAEGWGSAPEKAAGTLHYGGQWPANTYSGSQYFFPNDGRTSEFHVYAIEWEPEEIRWYVDSELYQQQDSWYSAEQDYPAPFDRTFYMILNLAVGGHFDGDPTADTAFPAEMCIDYVRVYEMSEE